MTKRPIDLFRESGGKFAIYNPDDGTAIREMVPLGDRLIIFTEKCTYKIQLADQIDPQRTNYNLPHNVQQKLFDFGTNSAFLSRTVLTAKRLLNKSFLPKALDADRALELSFLAFSEIAAMNEVAEEFRVSEINAVEAMKLTAPRSLPCQYLQCLTCRPGAKRLCKKLIMRFRSSMP